MNKDTGKYWGKAWQLVDGCYPVSAGCDNCWSAGMTHRFKDGLTTNGKFNGAIRIREDRLDLPLKTKRPTVWAVWNDLFHEDVPASFILNAFEVMSVNRGESILTEDGYKTYPKHTFLILTKRPERIHPVLFGQEGNYYFGGGDYLENVWLGTSVENQEQADKRIPELIKGAGEFKKFLSIEPMLGEIDLRKWLPHKYISEHGHDYATARYRDGEEESEPPCWICGQMTNVLHHPLGMSSISQVICGGETGPKARPCNLDWVRNIRDQCQAAGVPFFFKGWGEWVSSQDTSIISTHDNTMVWAHGGWNRGRYASHTGEAIVNMVRVGHKAAGRLLDGRTHDDLIWRISR